MCSSIYAVLLLILLPSPQMTISLSQDEFNRITEGVHFAEALTTAMKPLEFTGFLENAASMAISFIGNTLEFIQKILYFPGSNESQELLDIKQLYNEMNTQFDSFYSKFGSIQSKINWSHVQFPFLEIQAHINSTEQYFKRIYEGPLAEKTSGKDFFLRSWEADCRNCALHLYYGITGKNTVLVEGIMHTAVTALHNNRPETQTFMLGIFKLLIIAITNELAYRKLKYSDADALYNKQLWAIRLHNVTNKMKSINTIAMSDYHMLAEKDAANFALHNPTNVLNNENFSAQLYKFIVDKYDWRDWLVIVYKPIWGSDGHNNNVCDGYRLYRTYGRNIVISSVDQSKPAINTTIAMAIIRATSTGSMDSKGVFNTLPVETKNCTIYASVGVIDSWVDLWYQGKPERLAHKRTPGRNSYSIHLFG